MIAYTFHPDAGFLRRGVLRAYFVVERRWARVDWFDVIMVAFLSFAAFHDFRPEPGLPDWLYCVLLACGVLAVGVIWRVASVVFAVVGIMFGVRARPMPTHMWIEPGQWIASRDMIEHRFDWSALRQARRFKDMYVLLFQDSPVTQVPVIVSRSHLGAEEARFAAALPA